MKVLLVATVQSHICQFHRPLVAMLHEHGCEVHVAARNNLAEKNGLKLDFVEQVFDVPFQRSPFSPKNLGAYKQLKKIIDEGNYDVVHCNTPVGGVLGRLAARKARKRGTKVFYTAHGFHFYKVKTVKASEADADFIPEVPIVTHEIGQYETYPNFKEIEKYTGSLKARNFEVFRERLDEKGLLPLAEDYFKCSGKLAVQCYKEEMEAVFRSRLLGGFQILDIQDFSGQGTALVGVLDAFMDSKGLITDSEWREFCNDAVVMARFDSYVLEAGSSFKAHTELCNYRPDLKDGKLICTLTLENGVVIGKVEKNFVAEGNYTDICDVEFTLPQVTKNTKTVLALEIEGTDIRNHYDLWVIPTVEKTDISGAYIFDEVNAEAVHVYVFLPILFYLNFYMFYIHFYLLNHCILIPLQFLFHNIYLIP